MFFTKIFFFTTAFCFLVATISIMPVFKRNNKGRFDLQEIMKWAKNGEKGAKVYLAFALVGVVLGLVAAACMLFQI
jgi:hypothetical protein